MEASMKKKILIKSLLVGVFLVFAVAFPVLATSPFWMNFYGNVSQNGQPLAGAKIEVFVEGILVGSGTSRADGSYGLLPVYGDDPTTSEKDGANPGDTLTFYVNGQIAGTATWTGHGDVQRLNLVVIPVSAVTVPKVGNLVTCVRPYPSNSWIKIYQLTDNGTWVDINPHGWGPIDSTGFLKIDGLAVDYAQYGSAGHPYRVELWADGTLIRSTGDMSQGTPDFRIRSGTDNMTPWGCPAP
jgi:hypothetical protein